MKAAAQIASPSRLFARDVGEPIAEGVAAGIRSGTPSAVTAAVDMVTRSIRAATGAAPSTSGPITGGANTNLGTAVEQALRPIGEQLLQYLGGKYDANDPQELVAVSRQLWNIVNRDSGVTLAELSQMSNALKAFQGDKTPAAIDAVARALDALAGSASGAPRTVNRGGAIASPYVPPAPVYRAPAPTPSYVPSYGGGGSTAARAPITVNLSPTYNITGANATDIADKVKAIVAGLPDATAKALGAELALRGC